MSPFLQRKQKSQQLTASPSTSPTQAPHQWLRPNFNRSVPNLARLQQSNRPLGISSIKQLARSSRRALNQPQTQRLRSSSSLYGTLRDQCTPPSPDPNAKAPKFTEIGSHHSHRSSVDSITPDQSGLSIDSSHPTTPSPGKPRAFRQLNTVSNPQSDNMGQTASTLARKPLSLKAKQSLATFRSEQERGPSPSVPDPVVQPPSATKPPPGKSSLRVQVPRRRSSLTAIHLNSSHFDTFDPKQPKLQHRSSTLTEPGRRPSGLSESIRPIISSSGTIVLTPQTNEALSPPLLSPPVTSPRGSSTSSNSPSDNRRTSPIPSHIHLPRTFPKGPVPIPAPPMTIVHMKCYQGHRRMLPSANKYNPVPCMVCKQGEHDKRWRCPFCALRICGPCMAEFDRRGRDLEAIVDWMDKLKEEDQKATEGITKERYLGSRHGDDKENKWKDNRANPADEPDKLRIKRLRETM